MHVERTLALSIAAAMLFAACASESATTSTDTTTTPPAVDAGAPADADADASPSARTLTSSDGKLTIDLPDGALPADVEIEIEAMTSAEGWPAYLFSPAGLELGTPAEISLSLDADELGRLAPSGSVVRLGPYDADAGTGVLTVLDSTLGTDGVVLRATTTQLVGVGVDGLDVAWEQLSPEPQTIRGESFAVEGRVSDEAGEPLELRRIGWLPDFYATEARDECEPAGEYRRTAWFGVDREIGDVGIVSVVTDCIDPAVVTALALSDSPFDAPEFTGEVVVHTDPSGEQSIGFRAEDVPPGGSIGINFVAPDLSGFVECLVDRRPGNEGVRCAARDSVGNAVEVAELVERVVSADGSEAGVDADAGSLEDRLVLMTMVALIDPIQRELLIGSFSMAIGDVTVNQFQADGTLAASTVDLDSLVEAVLSR